MLPNNLSTGWFVDPGVTPWAWVSPAHAPSTKAVLYQSCLNLGDAHYGAVLAVISAIVLWFLLSKTLKGFEIAVLGQNPRAGRFAGFSAKKMTIFAFLGFRCSGRLGGHRRSLWFSRQARRQIVTGLWLCRHYRRLPWPSQSTGHRGSWANPCTVLYRWRSGSDFTLAFLIAQPVYSRACFYFSSWPATR